MMGRELRTIDGDLDLFATECADAREELEQDVLHILVERKGSNLDDLNRGESIDEWLSAPDTSPPATGRVDEAIRRDRRVSRVATTVTDGTSAGEKRLVLEIHTDDETLLEIDLALDADGLRRADT